MNLKRTIDHYCYTELLDPPQSDGDYRDYAMRFMNIGIITLKEYNDFVKSLRINELES